MKNIQKRQLVTSDEAVDGKVQHTQPCSDCPMAKSALPGWLGMATPQEYVQLAHSDCLVDCHTIRGQQCAGMAIYRANVFKRCDPPNLVLPKNPDLVFATPMAFLEHHSRRPVPGIRHEVAEKAD